MKKESRDKQIVNSYRSDLMPIKQISQVFSLSRTTIYRILDDANVALSSKVLRVCRWCDEDIVRYRSLVRGHNHHFCSGKDCFAKYSALRKEHSLASPFNVLARAKIKQHFEGMQDLHIIHRIDDQIMNSDLSNILVFSNERDHIKHHRGEPVTPLWDGRGSDAPNLCMVQERHRREGTP